MDDQVHGADGTTLTALFQRSCAVFADRVAVTSEDGPPLTYLALASLGDFLNRPPAATG